MNYPERQRLEREYALGKRTGFILTILAPLTAAILLISLLPGEVAMDLEGTNILIISILIFSLATGFMARLVLQRMSRHVRRLLGYSRYRKNLLLFAMIVFYLLLFCPALWGMIVYSLVRNLPAYLTLTAISALGYYLLTPSLKDLLKD